MAEKPHHQTQVTVERTIRCESMRQRGALLVGAPHTSLRDRATVPPPQRGHLPVGGRAKPLGRTRGGGVKRWQIVRLRKEAVPNWYRGWWRDPLRERGTLFERDYDRGERRASLYRIGPFEIRRWR